MKRIFLVFCIFLTQLLRAQNPSITDFRSPPNAAKPRVWWHWMNGNISKEGIQKDLDWMSRVGIGGFQNFDANLLTPVVVPKKLVFMTPDWKDAFKFTTELAIKNKLEMAIAGSPGWSVTGGPWVEPQDAMKKYVWTETLIASSTKSPLILKQPASILSNFQDVALAEGGFTGGFVGQKPNFYADAAVIAFKIAKQDIQMASLNPKVSSSGGDFSLKNLTDGDLNCTTLLPPMEEGQDMWIQYEFETPQTFKALSVVGALHGMMEQFNGSTDNRSLKVSDDGVNFREVCRIHGSIVPQTTVNFTPTIAKYFRFVNTTLPGEANPFAALMGGSAKAGKPSGIAVAEFNLFTTARINKAEDKAGFLPYKETYNETNARENSADIIQEVLDLSNKMDANGNLNWTPPANADGSEATWNIIRFGYSLTGRQNHPASPEATGLEVDKLDKNAVKRYINTYLDMYKDATGGLMGTKGLQYMILDSYEAGHMNWTKDFPAEFNKRRGYSLLKWIPTLTGRVVNSTAESEKFLWDFRKTIGELIAENHYDVIGDELHKRGMKRYTESHEGGRIYLADGMDVKRNADIPMSAMWTPGSLVGGKDEEVRSEGDIRESASVANIYGKPIVAAESMTSVGRPFQEHPERLKRTADLEFASGLNRFVIHTSVHQPLDDKKPGFSLGPFGQYFTRHETWAEAGGKAWMAYLGRSSYMLQQGKNVADVLYYYGENTNITMVCKDKLPSIPAGYEFDFVNSTALIEAISAQNGKLVAKSGNMYRVLVLDESAKNMTLAVLKKLEILADAGVKIVGMKPEKSPSLADDDAVFQKIAAKIWAKPNISNVASLAQNATGIAPDLTITKAESKILYRHRNISMPGKPSTDIYWLNNRSDNALPAVASFRVSGKVPVLWHPETGKTTRLAYQIINGRTVIPLKFESWEAYFVVFSDVAKSKSLELKPLTESPVLTVTIPWKVSFNNTKYEFMSLNSWSENTDKAIKYFSGTAIYENTFNIDKKQNAKYILDLGEVKNLAEVIINGQNIGTAWKKPFKLELSDAIKVGENTIQIRVTNTWVNRLIGDAQPDVTEKTTFTTMPFYRGTEPLVPSGLLSEVKISVIK